MQARNLEQQAGVPIFNYKQEAESKLGMNGVCLLNLKANLQ